MPESDAKPASKALSGPQRAMQRLGLLRPIDLALHLPLRYEDETRLTTVAAASRLGPVQIDLEVAEVEPLQDLDVARDRLGVLHGGGDEIVEVDVLDVEGLGTDFVDGLLGTAREHAVERLEQLDDALVVLRRDGEGLTWEPPTFD